MADLTHMDPFGRDERALMGRTAGVLWALASIVALLGQLLPGPDNQHPWVVLALCAVGLAYGAACFTGLVPWETMSLRQHVIGCLALYPLCGVIFWATGGAESYALPLTVLPLFFSAYFFPRKVALGLVTVLILIAAAPLVYEPASRDSGYPALVLGIAAAWYTLTLVIFALKSRLVEAERVQREMAVRDALTGLGNRRAFDAALLEEVMRAEEIEPGRDHDASALLFVDLDRFKEINDSYGHSAGDRLLRAVAARCSAVLRPSDTLARIGGDEFAVVAPRAGREGAERMAEDLKAAVGSAWQSGDADPMTATVSFALLGEDGHSAPALMRAADRRLHDAKRARTALSR